MSKLFPAIGGVYRLRSVATAGVQILLTVALIPLAYAQPGANADLSENTRAQIESIQAEKALRSPSQKKLDSQLIYALRQQRFGMALTSATALRSSVQTEADGLLLVDVVADVTPDLLQFIKAQGGEVLSQFPQHRTLRARIPLALAETLATRADVRFVQPAIRALTHVGDVETEGDVAHQANLVRAQLQLGGAGVKIGVLSDSATFIEDSQSQGELPAVTILPGAFGDGTGEGTAMMEIIHDLAPEADLYFATAFGSVATFAENIRRLYAAGCRVIVDDVIYFNESPFQDGPIAQAVNEVCAGGALYFSSAGNEGNLKNNTGGMWEGDFSDGGPATFGRGGRLHSFGGAPFNTVLPGGGIRRLDLFWADPLGQSTNDYDLYVVNTNGNVVSTSANIQNGAQDPYEWIGSVNAGERVVVVKHSGSARYLYLSALRGRLTFVTPGSTRGHNAADSPFAFSVAATEAPKPPMAFTGGPANPVETFSSEGPRRKFFQANGQAVTPGNFSSTGGVIFQKPDVTGADGVSTSVPGFESFFGTSAAAPHVAALAALLWSYNPALTPEQIRVGLTVGVLDIEDPGWDQNSGVGIPTAPLLVAAVPAPIPNLLLEGLQLADANASGSLDASECAELRVGLRNLIGTNGAAATGVSGVLTSLTPGVFAEPIPVAFPEVPPGGLATNELPFRISSAASYVCWQGAELRLEITAANAGPFTFPIQIAPVTNGVGATIQYVASGVPVPIPDSGELESPITVQGFSGALARVTVALHIQHTYDSDLRIALESPDGTEVLLSGNHGGSGQNFGLSCVAVTVFSDTASNSIAAGTSPFVGSFRPDEPLSTYWSRSGDEVNGTWKLKVADVVESDTGSLQCWSLRLSPIVCQDAASPCLFPPVIVDAPDSLVATNGDIVSFSVTATGSEPLSYHWLLNETNNLSDSTGSVLTLTNVQPEQAGSYSVVVSNYYGVASSAAVQLDVLVRPFIISQPVSMVATNGDDVVLAVEAGGTEPLAYQWFFQGTNALVEGTTAALVLTNVNPVQAGQYNVRVENAIGSAVSDAAQLTVLVRPEILVQPADVVATNGNLVRLEIVATGSEPLAYQWWFEETNLVAGATAAILELPGILPEAAGRYTVEVSNVVGVVRSRDALVSVLTAPTILADPISQTATNGDTVELAVAAVGSEPLEYQWWFQTTNAIAEATNATLVFSNVSPAQSGEYAVVVKNFLGSVTSAPALLTILVGPEIVVEPADIVATNGDLVRLEIEATGTEPLAYQWWYEETNLVAGATAATLELPGILPEAAGRYTVEVSNVVGVVRSRDALVSVLTAPTILSGPASQVATNGDTVELAVAALGSEPLEYQWWFQTTNLLAEATNASLVLSNVTVAQGGDYSVVVSNFLGSVTSAPALLTVLIGPEVVVEPADIVATNGDLVRLEVGATGSEPLAYQWWFEETNLVAGATAAILELPVILPEQAGRYAVEISNVVGTIRSRNARLTVLQAPVILAAPASLAATNGDTVELTVSVTGSEPLFYQWWRKLFNSPVASWQAIAAETNSSLLLTNVAPTSNGEYAVVVSNFVGSVTSAPARLTVLLRPEIVAQPADVVATNGDMVEFSVVSTGSEPLSYQWWFEETNLVAGATSATLELPGVSREQAGRYAVEVSNAVGVVRSREALLIVQTPPSIAVQPVSQSVRHGDTAEFAVIAEGSEPLEYQWWARKISDEGPLQSALAGETNATLVLSNVTPFHLGEYLMVVSNFLGSVTSAPALLTLLQPPQIVAEPADVVATNGGGARLEVVANGALPLSYQWWFEETNLVAGATASVLELLEATSEQAGRYAVVVSNVAGSTRSRDALVNVLTAPAIALGPASQMATNGDMVELAVMATGSEPLEYQWWFQATNALARATNAMLSLSNVTAAAEGEYIVVVSNFLGSVTSTPALLTVLVGPAIVLEPADVVATNGDLVRLEVVATGSEPLEYQWWYDETNVLAGATSAVLELPSVSPEQAGRYAVEVSNAVGTARSREAQLTVRFAPVIGLPPQDLTVVQGESALLAVSASADPLPHYQWFFNATNSATTGAVNVVWGPASLLPGATNATLELTNVTPAQGGEYAVAVSNFLGSITSAPALLIVLVGPGIAVEPGDVVATNGDLVVLEVVATGSQPLTYQWWFEETNAVTGATSAVLELPAITPEQTGRYVVEVSNHVGTVRSREALVTVLTGPEIVVGPITQTATNGDTVEFSVVADGSEPLGYQWWFESTNVLAEATNSTLVLSNLTLVQAGEYAVVVSNFLGSVTSAPALLTVLVPPQIVLEPVDVLATNGDLVRLEVVAAGSEPLTYQWWLEETNLLAGATTSVLELPGVTPGQAGSYLVEIGNPVGAIRSRQALVAVLSGPAITAQPMSQLATNAGTVEFVVAATGSEPLGYQWWFESTNVLAEATNSILVLSNVTPAQAGEYAVVVSNFLGSVTSAPALLTVLAGPEIVLEPADVVATNGDLVRLEVVATGSEPLTYQWFEETNAVAGGRSPILELPGIQPEQAGRYAVAVSNAVGTVRSRTALVTVLTGPMILSEPTSQVVNQGSTAEFAVVATGSEPLEYQWWFQATNAIAEATNATLVLSNVSPAQSGEYAVMVSNFLGGVTSAPALLAVLVAPEIVIEPADVVATNGDLVRLEVVATGSEPLAYQWWFEETNLVTGATAAILELPGILPEQAGRYAVEVSNVVGVVRSRDALVSVLTAPIIMSDPMSLIATNGDTVEMAVVATGSEPLQYQWWFQTTNAITEATNASLVLGNVTVAQQGGYSVVVSNFLGSVTSATALLTVLMGPEIVLEPADVVATNGDLVRFEVAATGSEPLAYRWWFEETNLVANATTAILELPGVMPDQAGNYAVEVSNAVGAVRSRLAQLTLFFAPVIDLQPENLAVPEGGSGQLAISARAFPAPDYQWYFNATNLLADETNAVLLRTNVQPASAGQYHVQVSNLLGVVTSSVATVTIGIPPRILVEPQNLTIRSGLTAAFNVQATGTPPLGYVWYFEGTNQVAASTSASLFLTNVTASHSGVYHALATNAFGAAASRGAALRVLAPSVIAEFTQSGTVFNLHFTTAPGLRYTVQYVTNLNDTVWLRVGGASKLVGTGEIITVQDSAATNATRFYRVLVE